MSVDEDLCQAREDLAQLRRKQGDGTGMILNEELRQLRGELKQLRRKQREMDQQLLEYLDEMPTPWTSIAGYLRGMEERLRRIEDDIEERKEVGRCLACCEEG